MGFGGGTLIETRGFCTVKIVEPASEPAVAEILVVPKPALVASPCEPDVLLIVATAADEEAHATAVVMFAVVPSVYSPVATNSSTPPIGMNGLCCPTPLPS